MFHDLADRLVAGLARAWRRGALSEGPSAGDSRIIVSLWAGFCSMEPEMSSVVSLVVQGTQGV